MNADGRKPSQLGERGAALRIVFFSQEDPFFVKAFFDEFLPRYAAQGEIKAVVLSRALGKPNPWKLATQMLQFYGAIDFARMCLRYAHYAVQGRRAVRPVQSGRPAKTYSIRQLAASYGLPVIERSDLNSEDFRGMIKCYEADLFVSVASPVIFRKALLEMPRLGCINIHNAPLPRYRGMLPTFWQLLHGETQIGITVHRMNEGIDTGDILAQGFFPVLQGESLAELMARCKREGAHLIAGCLDDFRGGTVKARKMLGEGSYFSFPTRRDVRAFRRRGGRLC